MSSGKSALGKRRAAATKAPMATKKPRKPRGMVELPEGLTLTDLTKKQWRIGRLIGWGGFGALYLGNKKLQFSLIQIGSSSNLRKRYKNQRLRVTQEERRYFKFLLVYHQLHGTDFILERYGMHG